MIDTEELRPEEHRNHGEEAGIAGGIIEASHAIGAVFHRDRLAA